MTIRYRALSLVLASSGLAACGGESVGTGDEQFATEGPPLAYQEYEVRFTNPTCKLYEFPADMEVYSEGGERLYAKPKDVFCGYDDTGPSSARPESPQYKLIEWIEDPATTEIFFTYLSFSNSAVTSALCSAIEERDVKVTFVLDSSSDQSKADQLLACQPASGDPDRAPRFEARGHTPGIGYAHNKLFMVNPGAETMKLAFSSGNMSSGVVLHHENWHFITVPSSTYFAQAHICLMSGELDHYRSKTEYRDFMEGCLEAIEYPEEGDIQAFFVPADRYAASDRLLEAVSRAEKIDIAAHRFTYTKLIGGLKRVLDQYQVPMRLIADDDMYWAGNGNKVGDNLSYEYYNAVSLTNRGAEARWMETNHDAHLLHHNKFLILDSYYDEDPDAVFCGAGNLTGTGFSENWENYYYVTIPEVVEAFRTQYEHMWNNLATPGERMPTDNVMPF